MTEQQRNPLPWPARSAQDTVPILLVRHGQTARNREQRFNGRDDVPLNATGEAQAKRLADRLHTMPFQQAFSSPLQRAIQTAGPILSGRDLSLQIDERLAELDQGALDGLYGPELPRRFPDIFKAWRADPSDVQLPGGETLRQCQARFVEALMDIGAGAQPGGPPVLVVAHSMAICTALCAAIDLDLRLFRHVKQRNTAINLISYTPGRLQVRRLNDAAHLEDSPL
ncbi:MAG: histidine phosphatase family protein [Myxococcota bacterium]